MLTRAGQVVEPLEQLLRRRCRESSNEAECLVLSANSKDRFALRLGGGLLVRFDILVALYIQI